MKNAKISRLKRRCKLNRLEYREKQSNSHVLDKLVRATNVLKLCEPYLRNDRTKLSRRSRDTVSRGPVARGENLTGDDERRRIGAEVLEEVGEAVEEDERLLVAGGRGELVVREAHDDEQTREDREAHELDGLAAPCVDEEEGGVITGDETSSGEDDVADGDVVQVLVDLGGLGESLRRRTETNGLQDDRGVEAETVERNLESQNP